MSGCVVNVLGSVRKQVSKQDYMCSGLLGGNAYGAQEAAESQKVGRASDCAGLASEGGEGRMVS